MNLIEVDADVAVDQVEVRSPRTLSWLLERGCSPRTLMPDEMVGDVMNHGDTVMASCRLMYIHVRGWKTGRVGRVPIGSVDGAYTITQVKMGRWDFRGACLSQN